LIVVSVVVVVVVIAIVVVSIVFFISVPAVNDSATSFLSEWLAMSHDQIGNFSFSEKKITFKNLQLL